MNKFSRRDFLLRTSYGLGGIAVSAFLPGGGIMSSVLADDVIDPLAPKQPHFPAKVKSVIWLHMDGAPSTLDLFDYKPELAKLGGQDVPPSFLKGIKTSTQGGVSKLFWSGPRSFKQYGQSGAWFSDLVPNLAQHADKIGFIKSSTTVGATHDISILKLNTGDLWALGSLMLWAQPILTCRPTSCYTTARRNRPEAPSTGVPASCPRSTKAPPSAPVPTPFSTWTAPSLWPTSSSATTWTCWPA